MAYRYLATIGHTNYSELLGNRTLQHALSNALDLTRQLARTHLGRGYHAAFALHGPGCPLHQPETDKGHGCRGADCAQGAIEVASPLNYEQPAIKGTDRRALTAALLRQIEKQAGLPDHQQHAGKAPELSEEEILDAAPCLRPLIDRITASYQPPEYLTDGLHNETEVLAGLIRMSLSAQQLEALAAALQTRSGGQLC